MLTPRSILFVDGENLVMRYQDMLNSGRRANGSVVHIPDVFVWHPRLVIEHGLRSVIRVLYYTSVVGDDVKIAETQRRIADEKFGCVTDNGAFECQLVPVVFKKQARSQKTRNVDIQIVIDVMRFAFTDEVDRVYVISGDGDYLPLFAEVMRRGKQVELLAFSIGCHERLLYSVDYFSYIDSPFFEPL